MFVLNGNVTDQNEAVVIGAQVYVYDDEGQTAELFNAAGDPIENPLLTGESGYFEGYVVLEGIYTLDFFWGGRRRYKLAGAQAGRSYSVQAQEAAERAEIAAQVLISDSGIYFLTPEDGVDPVTGVPDGRNFNVTQGGRFYLYRNNGGVAELLVEFVTAPTDASTVGTSGGGTVQDFIDEYPDTVVDLLSNPSASDAAAMRRGLQVASVEALKNNALNYNGNHRVSQEVGAVEQTGIGSASPGTQKWMTDGHKLWVQGSVRVKAQQMTITDLPGFSRSLRLEVTTAQASIGSDFIRHMSFCAPDDFTPMAWGTLQARDMVRYCWVRTSMAGTYEANILNDARDAAVPGTFVVDTPGEWQLVKTTFTGATTGTWNSGGLGYRCEVSLAGNTSPNLAVDVGHYFEYTGEIFLPGDYDPGLTDTALLMPSLQANLARCERYYEKSYNMSTVPGTALVYAGAVGMITEATANYHTTGQIRFSSPKATIPTITLYSPETGAAGKTRNASTSADINLSSSDAGAKGFNAFVNDIAVNAANVLVFHYVADARIG